MLITIVTMENTNIGTMIIAEMMANASGKIKLWVSMHAAYEEIVSVSEIVRASDLDWTIVRLTLLNNHPESGKVKVGYLGRREVGTWISRADIAGFMLKQIPDSKYLRQAPVISN